MLSYDNYLIIWWLLSNCPFHGVLEIIGQDYVHTPTYEPTNNIKRFTEIMGLDLVSRLPGTNTWQGRLSNLMQE